MESHQYESKISTMVVDFGLSKDMTSMLLQLKGVESISIDPNEGKVKVVGNINPTMVIKVLQEMGKRAQLRSFHKSPKESRASSSPKHKNTSHCCYESDSDEKWKKERNKKRHSRKNVAPQPPFTGYHPSMPHCEPYKYARPMSWYQPEPVQYAKPYMYPSPMSWCYGPSIRPNHYYWA